MEPATLTQDGNVAHLHLDDGRANALSTSMLKTLMALVQQAHGADALWVTGRPKIFSGGLDLAHVVPMPAAQLEEFLQLFHDAFRAFLAFERPMVMAVAGSAVAGGAVLLCCGDIRLGAQDSGWVGVNEVQLGLPFPTVALEAVRSALAGPQAAQALLEGTLFNKEDALKLGYFHQLYAPEVLLEKAQARVKALAAIPTAASAAVKRALRAPHLHRTDTLGPMSNAAFAQVWSSPDAQARLKEVLARLKK